MQSENTSFSEGLFVEKVFSTLGGVEVGFSLITKKAVSSFSLCQIFTHLLS